MKKKLPDNQITVYQTSDGKINIEVLCANENIWLPQKRMAELFGCSADNISLHLKNIYKDRELDASATAEDFSVVQMEGRREAMKLPRRWPVKNMKNTGSFRIRNTSPIQQSSV